MVRKKPVSLWLGRDSIAATAHRKMEYISALAAGKQGDLNLYVAPSGASSSYVLSQGGRPWPLSIAAMRTTDERGCIGDSGCCWEEMLIWSEPVSWRAQSHRASRDSSVLFALRLEPCTAMHSETFDPKVVHVATIGVGAAREPVYTRSPPNFFPKSSV